MLKIGLTGGIGAGKSVVSDIFSSLGAPVIDADVVSREILHAGSPCLKKLVQKLGPTILTVDGNLHRERLKKILFENTETREMVDSILHPVIKSSMMQQIGRIQAKYCLLVVPLLIEKNWDSWVDRVLLVVAPEPVRIQRIRDRDQLDTKQIQRILDSQWSESARLSKADDVIHNDKNLKYLTEQVSALHRMYTEKHNFDAVGLNTPKKHATLRVSIYALSILTDCQEDQHTSSRNTGTILSDTRNNLKNALK